MVYMTEYPASGKHLSNINPTDGEGHSSFINAATKHAALILMNSIASTDQANMAKACL